MPRADSTTRRRIMQLTGATAVSALLAGCSDGGGGDDGGGDGGGDDGTGDGGGGTAIEPGTQILFSAQTSAWIGVEPEAIADEENPTITVQEGEDYEIGWQEGDGAVHNIEIRDENDEVVDDYETEEVAEPGEDQILDVTVTSEMAQYVCNPHENSMVGDMQIE